MDKLTQPTGTSFLDLPAEIRNDIYHYILQPVKGTKTRLSLHEPTESDVVHPLLHTCQQVRNEAGPVFYSNAMVLCPFEKAAVALQRLNHLGWTNIEAFRILPTSYLRYDPTVASSADRLVRRARRHVRAAGLEFRHDILQVWVRFNHYLCGRVDFNNPGTYDRWTSKPLVRHRVVLATKSKVRPASRLRPASQLRPASSFRPAKHV